MRNQLKSIIRRSSLSSLAHNIYYKLGLPSQNAIYDQQTVEVMRGHLKENSVCIDIGANMGTILKQLITIAPQGKHFAFEPIPHLAISLRKNFPQAHIYEFALSDQCGELEFHHVVNMEGLSGLRQRVYGGSMKAEINKIVVRTERLDNLIPPDTSVAFIKIDIEGAEYLAMRGGVETIKRSRPVIVFEAGKDSTSCYGIKPEEIFDFLKNECQLEVSTMKKWLEDKQPFSRKEFCQNFNRLEDYYFIAYPKLFDVVN